MKRSSHLSPYTHCLVPGQPPNFSPSSARTASRWPAPRSSTQVVRRLLRRTERNQVAEPLVDREERDPLAVALGPERGVELLGGEAGDEEVPVVDQGVANAGVGEVGGKLRLPDPLGEPESPGVDTEAPAHRLVHPVDLFDPVLARQRGEHRLVEAGQQDLDAAVGGEAAQPVEVCRLVVLEPLEQRPAQVQHDRKELRGR